MARRSSALTSLPWSDPLAAALEQAALAIGRLNARISASPVRSAWQIRAAWSGYSKALQLQGVEIDEIDVFAWGCAIPLPGRARISVNGQRTLHPTPHANSPDRQNSLHRRYFLTPFNIRAAALDDGASLRP
ncbi:MAG: hypothetical protein J0I73_01355 [Sphingomonas sp.]|uniref:hypothetical protein n=1 Tax=Sphingomonas sp. TaxID=28214 RepID=UPI001ACB572F|nr:hypothetical protein [Sphingomonas sp.]MBN8846733.1 hypothetical protein [Sphingomonas sp.]